MRFVLSGIARWLFAAFALLCAPHAYAEPGAPLPGAAPVRLMTRDPGLHDRVSMTIVSTAPKLPQGALAAKSGAGAGGAGAAGAGAAGAGAAQEAHANIHVQGLTGTLNKGDVHQTMEARQADFNACIEASRRRLQWVSGAIHFAFRVDGEGRVMSAHAASSTLGHRELEACLTNVVLATQFPKPAGRATAEFSWQLSVEPARAHPLEVAKGKVMASAARKQVRALFSACEIKRRRARFQITAYIAAGGKLLSAGAVATPAHADDKLDCVLDELSNWHLPKLTRTTKVSFELR